MVQDRGMFLSIPMILAGLAIIWWARQRNYYAPVFQEQAEAA